MAEKRARSKPKAKSGDDGLVLHLTFAQSLALQSVLSRALTAGDYLELDKDSVEQIQAQLERVMYGKPRSVAGEATTSDRS